MKGKTVCGLTFVFASSLVSTPVLLGDDQQPMPGQPIQVTGQALRVRLTVEPVNVEMVQSELPVPGVLEADPTSVVRIFPPVTGHLVKIWVQLGDSVEEG